MSHRATQTSPLPSHLQQLSWALFSPNLMTTDWHWPLADRQRVLAEAEKQPSALLKMLDEQTDKRLGAQFETYLAYGLRHSQHWQLLRWGQVIRQRQGRIVETIGEMDFIVRDQHSGEVLQLEVASKFYIAASEQANAGQQATHWLGPAKKDSLARKLSHMQNQQLQMWQHPIVQAELANDGITIDRSVALLKGRLFYPLAGCHAPTDSNPNHLRGIRCLQSEMQSIEPNANCWQPLVKPQWLASTAAVQSDGGRLKELNKPLERPQQFLLHGAAANAEPEWVFVLPDGW